MELSMTRATAFACWRLGDRGPMETLLDEFADKRRTASMSRSELMQHYFNLGYTFNMIRRHREALRAYRSCVILYKGDTLKQENWGQIAQYNIACIHAMTGNVRAGIRALHRAIDLLYLDDRWMTLDGDLDNLRGDPRFSLCMARIMMRRADQMDSQSFLVQLNHEKALDHLTEAVDRGLSLSHWVEADPLYKPLRSSPAYRKLVGRLLARAVLRGLGLGGPRPGE